MKDEKKARTEQDVAQKRPTKEKSRKGHKHKGVISLLATRPGGRERNLMKRVAMIRMYLLRNIGQIERYLMTAYKTKTKKQSLKRLKNKKL